MTRRIFWLSLYGIFSVVSVCVATITVVAGESGFLNTKWLADLIHQLPPVGQQIAAIASVVGNFVCTLIGAFLLSKAFCQRKSACPKCAAREHT